MKRYITNKAKTVVLPFEEGMVEWLNENYPFSKYYIVEYE